MKIIYASGLDAGNVNVQSGYPYFILRAFESQGHDIIRAFPMDTRMRYLFAPKHFLYKSLGKTYRPDRESIYLRSIARQIERRVRGIDADFVFCMGSHAAAELRTNQPKILLGDATFENVLSYYWDFSDCTPAFVALGHEMEHKALTSSDLVILPSEWAKRSAVDFYGVEPKKIHVIPFGANIEAPNKDAVHVWIGKRNFDKLRFLFVGKDWGRKGGDIVLATCELLRKQGLNIQLDLVGLADIPVELPKYTVNHGMLEKSDPSQKALLEKLFREAHLFFMPSRAEAYGLVYCEAAAFGVPSIATATGGIPTIVRNEVTGFALPPGSTPEAFAETIGQLLSDPARYQTLALSSRDEYEARLNWTAFTQQFFKHVRQMGLGV